MVADLRAASAEWAATPVRARTAALTAFLDDFVAGGQATAAAVAAATGKPPPAAMDEVVLTASTGRHIAAHAGGWLAEEARGGVLATGRRCVVRRVPLGVVGVIGPYNFPLSLTLPVALAAVTAGNGVLLKVSEATAGVGAAMEAALASCGGGVFARLVRVVYGAAAVGRALTSTVDHVVFVGSVGVGRAVASAAAARGVGCTLELGGKDPAIVLGGGGAAGMAAAARGIAHGAYYNAGQLCIGIERCFVLAPTFDAFVAALVAHVEKHVTAGWVPPGGAAPPGGSYTYGPAIVRGQLDHVAAVVGEAVAAGATVLTGGRPSACGRFYEPTVVTFPSLAAASGTRLMEEETFGPVLPVVPVPDVDAAVAAANGTPFGLNASVWTPDLRAGEAVARRLYAGGVLVNETMLTGVVPSLPFGGVGASGMGRVGGKEGFLSLTTPQVVIVGHGPSAVEWRSGTSLAARWGMVRALFGRRWSGVAVVREAVAAAVAAAWRWWKGGDKKDA